MPLDPNDIYHNGYYYSRNGGGGPVSSIVDPVTGEISFSSGASTVAARESNTIAFYGDSLTEQGSNYMTPTTVQAQSFTSAFWVKGTELLCPAGIGTLTYDATTKTLTWAAFGESAGAATDASKTGLVYVPSSVVGHGIYLDWFGGSRTFTSGSLLITAKAAGFNLLDYRVPGFVGTAMAFTQQALKIAYFQDAQNGNEAVYGLGGANTADFLSAAWQWSAIRSEVATLCIGQNDAPSGLTADQTIANIKAIIPLINAAKLVVCTLPPRNSDTTAQKKAKQRINHWIYGLLNGSSKLVFFDLFGYVADPTTGDYVAAYSADGVHPSGAGSITIGQPLAAVLLTLAGGCKRPTMRRGYLSQYDATSNLYGSSLVTAGMDTFEGSGGTANTGASGVIPAGYKLARTTGAAMTVVGSKVAYTDKPGSEYRMTFAGAVASEAVSLQPIATFSAGLAAGVVVEAYLTVNVVSSTGLEEISLSLYDNGSGTQVRAWYNAGSTIKDFTGPVVLRVPDWTLPVGFTNLTATIKVGTATGGSAVVGVGDFRVGPKQPV